MEYVNENGYLFGNENRYLALYKAAARGDWNGAKRIFDEEPSVVENSERLIFRENALYVAVEFGHSIEFVQNIINMMSVDSIAMGNKDGNTPLHAAAFVGNIEAAKLLVGKNSTATQRRNSFNDTPLLIAARFAHEELVRYLLLWTRDEDPSPFVNEDGVRLLNLLITADFFDIALHVLKAYPALALARAPNGHSALDILAKKPCVFPSGSQIGYCQRLLYQCFVATLVDKANAPQGGDVENQRGVLQVHNKKEHVKHFPSFQHIGKTMLIHEQAMELLRILISEANTSDSQINSIIGPAILNASIMGNQEFVAEAIKSYPYLVWIRDNDGCNILHLAIKHRQEKVFNLLYQTGIYNIIVTSLPDRRKNNILHLAGKLKPSNRISGAALQMQRELQWFKEVEKLVKPSFKEDRNSEGRTPKEVFTEEHINLVEKGEKWMKEAATSCATVAALVITVVFAAAFTVPGGNNQDHGTPIYLKETSFMIFVISDALGLFSSSTSLLMFLGILTSRYSEEDFLKALPMRLSIGLITLFFSIASMLTAFSAAMYLVLFHRVKWIAVPIGIATSTPIALFAFLQFPLLVEMVSSTFGPSVFHKQSEEVLF